MKLIQTKDYLLLISEEAEIKDADLVYEEELDVIFDIQPYGLPCNNIKTSKIIAYYPLNSEAKELKLPLLPPFEDDDDIESLATKSSNYEYGVLSHSYHPYKKGFKVGYKAAQSKQFTLEDMRKAFEYGKSLEPFDCFQDFIQSLSTQQLPKEFEIDYVDNGKGDMILHITTNSLGKDVLLGTYKY